MDYTASSHEQIAEPDLETVAFSIDSVSEGHGLPAFTYDIAIEVLGFTADLQQSLHKLLAPSGFLLMLKVNETKLYLW